MQTRACIHTICPFFFFNPAATDLHNYFVRYVLDTIVPTLHPSLCTNTLVNFSIQIVNDSQNSFKQTGQLFHVKMFKAQDLFIVKTSVTIKKLL